MPVKVCRQLLLPLLLVALVLSPAAALAAGCRVLVVMSYEESFPWVRDIREGIDSVLASTCEIRYFHLNTKSRFAEGPARAEEAFALFGEFQPDGVIVADDDAQAMFVPFLKDRVPTPVIFCGVNGEPEKYGYPAANVTGILERHHLLESISLARQIDPAIRSIGFMMKDSPVARLVQAQVAREAPSYPVRVRDFRMPSTLSEGIETAKAFRNQVDVLFIETMEGLPDESGRPLTDREVMPVLARAFGKPTIGANAYAIHFGLLCAVIKTGQEQGATAAAMLRDAMSGKPVSQIPITRNTTGKRMINVTTMKALGLAPSPLVLRGVELVRTVE